MPLAIFLRGANINYNNVWFAELGVKFIGTNVFVGPFGGTSRQYKNQKPKKCFYFIHSNKTNREGINPSLTS